MEGRPDTTEHRGSGGHRWRPTGWRLWALGALLVYALAGFFGLPWLARQQAPAVAENALGLELTIERVRFNPFTFRLQVDTLDARDPETGPVLRFAELVVDFQLSSLWRRAWTFREIRLVSPEAHLNRLVDGRSNLGVLLDRLSPTAAPPPDTAAGPPPDTPAAPPRVMVQALSMDQGQFTVRDDSRPTPWGQVLGPISVTAEDFSTLAEQDGRYLLTARAQGGGMVEWRGSLALVPLQSSGSLALSDLQLAPFWGYLQDDFDADVEAGTLAFELDYVFDASGPEPALRIAVSRAALEDLRVFRRSSGERLLALPQLVVADAGFDLETLQLSVATVDIADPDLAVRLLEDGRIDLQAALTPVDAMMVTTTTPPEEPAEETSTANSAPAEASAEASAPSPGLAIEMGTLRVTGGRVSFQDRSAPAQVELALEDFALTVTDYWSAEGHRAELDLSAGVASGGALRLTGSARAQPLEVGLALDVQAVSLLPLRPYLAAALPGLLLDSLTVGARGDLLLTDTEPFAFAGTGRMETLSGRLTDGSDPALGLSRLDAEGVNLSLARNELRITRIGITEPFARILIDEQGILNLSRLAGEAPAIPPEDQPPPAADASGAMAVGIGRIEITDGTMDFTDLNLPLPFRALVESMGGSISAVSLGSATPARAELDGTVLPSGATTLRATLDVFNPLRVMDLDLDFRNVEMSSLTPYTTQFAGRVIDGGRLDVDFKWAIRDSRLVANNRMLIRELSLGERVSVDGAMNLPLDLAVALLTDRNGRIEIDVPVTGDVNDPEFRYAALVFRALGNILGRLVTAPFSLLASLLGGDAAEADLEFVGFVAGDSAVLGPEAEDLSKLAQALAERPELRLNVGAAFHADRDGRAMRSRRLDEEVSRRFEVQVPHNDALEDPVRRILEAMYQEAVGTEALAALMARFSTPVTDNDAAADPPADRLDEAGYLMALREALMALQPLAEVELEALGAARAQAVRDYLTGTTALDPARIGLALPEASERADDNLIYLRLGLAAD